VRGWLFALPKSPPTNRLLPFVASAATSPPIGGLNVVAPVERATPAKPLLAGHSPR
jgi:hypothetical protein